MRFVSRTKGVTGAVIVLLLLLATSSLMAIGLPTYFSTLNGFAGIWLPRHEASYNTTQLSNDPPEVRTDRSEYAPGDVVYITGSGFAPGELVQLQVSYVSTGSAKSFRVASFTTASGHEPWSVTADDEGEFLASWLVEEDSLNQTIRLTADQGDLHAETIFADANNPSADIDQCANGGVGDPPESCNEASANNAGNWINGNLGASKSHFFEGDSIPYRLRFSNLDAGSHQVTIEWDTLQGGKHAIDELNAAAVGRGEIDQRNFGLQAFYGVERGDGVVGLGADAELREGLQDFFDTIAEDGMVVDDKQPPGRVEVERVDRFHELRAKHPAILVQRDFNQ